MNSIKLPGMVIFTILLITLLVGCSHKGDLAAPELNQYNDPQTMSDGSFSGPRALLGEFDLCYDFSQKTAWVESRQDITRSANWVEHNIAYGEPGSFLTDDDVGIQASVFAQDGHKLGSWHCMRVRGIIDNPGPGSLYDVRWIIDQQSLDLWHLFFITPNAYTDLFEDHYARNPYRAFCTEDPSREFPVGEEDAYMLFMIGTDPDYDPNDPDEVVRIHTWIDCALEPNTEEPVGIKMGAGIGAKFVLDLTDTDEIMSTVYWAMDHDRNWDEINLWANCDDHPAVSLVSLSLDEYGCDPAELDKWCIAPVTYDVALDVGDYAGGLYEILLEFTQNNLTPDEDWLTISDSIGQVQYVYHYKELEPLGNSANAMPAGMPVATSPKILDMGDDGLPELYANVADTTVVMAKWDGANWSELPGWGWTPPPPGDGILYCLGAVALSDQNDDGIKDVIVGYWKRQIGFPFIPLGEGQIYCIDGSLPTGHPDKVIWSKDYTEALGDVVASPIVIELDGQEPEEVIVMLDRPTPDAPHIEVLRWDDNLEQLNVVESCQLFHDLVPSEGIRTNGALVDRAATPDGHYWLACVSAGSTPSHKTILDDGSILFLLDLEDNLQVEASVVIPCLNGGGPVDIFNEDIVHIGPVIGDVDGDNWFEVILPRTSQINIYNHDLTILSEIQYGGIDADQKWNQGTTLLSESSAHGSSNFASCPALGDMTHDGKPDIVFGLEEWVVALTWVPEEESWNSQEGFDSVWTFHKIQPEDPGSAFWSHPVLTDMTRDGFLDVVIEAGGNFGAGYNLLAFDGSPANNHYFGLSDEVYRVLWTRNYGGELQNYQGIGQGACVASFDNNLGNLTPGIPTVHVGCVWSQHVPAYRCALAIYDSQYEGHGHKWDTQDKYRPPDEWPSYLRDRWNTASYGFPVPE